MNRPRILVLEDEQQWVDYICHVLESDGYEVRPTSSLDEAWYWLERETFGLAVVDIRLIAHDTKEESGFEFIEEVRTRETLQDMSIIVFTAYGTVERSRKAFREYRVHDFIDKATFDPQEFKRGVADAIAATYAGRQSL